MAAIRRGRLAVGIATVLAVAALVAGAVTGYAYVAGGASTPAARYCANMAESVGLYVGNPVTQMGYRVGEVTQIEPGGDHVRVTFELSGGRDYPADVRAVTRSKTVLADRSLELVGNYRGGPRLEPGRCIATSRTATPRTISGITDSATEFLAAAIPPDSREVLAGTAGGLAKALRGRGGDAEALMENAAAAMAQPDQLIADVGRTIQNLAPVTTTALSNWEDLRQIFTKLPLVAQSVNTGLWTGLHNNAVGIDKLSATVYDIQVNYGDIIWPLMDELAVGIHLAAARSQDIGAILSSFPSLVGFARQISTGNTGLTLAVGTPTVQMPVPGTGRTASVPVTDLLLKRLGR